MTGHAVGAAKEKKSPALLIVCERVLLAAGKPVNRRISKNQRELKLGDSLGKHIIGDWSSRLHFREVLAEEFSVRSDSVNAPNHFVPNGEVIARKDEPRGFDPLSWRNKRLGNQKVRFV